MNEKITYLGFNDMYQHKRGVENVIDFQSKASNSLFNYYLHWGSVTRIYKYKKLICISIKKNIFWGFVLNIILIKILIKNNGIFLHSHNPLMSIVSLFKTDLLTVHDALYYLNLAKKHNLARIFFWLEIFLYKRVKFVHFISKFAKNQSLFSMKCNKYAIIYNTSHFETFAFSKLNKLNLYKNFFKNETYKVLIVRSIEERARIDLLIELSQALCHENIEFIIAGKGPLLEFYRTKINTDSATNIKLLGYVTDEELLLLYEECNLVLMPAEYGEGFGLPIIEGYLFNKPVIASNRCAIPEIVESKDFLFENNVPDLIKKISTAKSCKNTNFRTFYNENFSNNVIIIQLNKLYCSLFKL